MKKDGFFLKGRFFKAKRWKIAGFLLVLVILLGIGSFLMIPAVTFHAPRIVFNRHTIPPFVAMVESGGKVATWNKSKGEMTIEKVGDSIKLHIDTEQSQGIPIYINGSYVGKSPLNKRLFPGKYEIVAKPPGYLGSIRYLKLSTEYPKDKQVILPVDRHRYQDYLDEILRLGYTPIKVMDYYNNVPITDKTLILRHDVDESADYALEMAELEKARGIKSSYYFRWCTADPEVIRKVRAMGHEVGLHYETLAFYAREMGLKSVEDITPTVRQELRRRLKFEIAEFERLHGDIYTIASHGAEENRRLRLTNYQAVMEGENPLDYGIIGTAYGPIIEKFSYMSDVGGIWEPFPYPELENNKGPFYFLIHPIHWVSSYTE
ncbi:MAG TPA: PEGA domain-containing protein [Desulfitobacterium dehalogenans]|uniref:PEGA domain-containing protein n=1 Tax=Desulfitobacterium dehalogenans TaxID=36854 RepID=A0A7C6Z6W7_9FIRM|nr:PEGA domain-containing protein [Desulfitobacterium dehalogenans]